MIEIAHDDVLGPELAMRGDTRLHELHLPTPLRYSEDLHYVRATRGGIKPFTQALGEIAAWLGLTVSSRQRFDQMVDVYFDAEPTEARPRRSGALSDAAASLSRRIDRRRYAVYCVASAPRAAPAHHRK